MREAYVFQMKANNLPMCKMECPLIFNETQEKAVKKIKTNKKSLFQSGIETTLSATLTARIKPYLEISRVCFNENAAPAFIMFRILQGYPYFSPYKAKFFFKVHRFSIFNHGLV